MKIKIVGHRAHPKPKETSGINTSEGIKFPGDIIDVEKDEAKMLIAMDRAEEVKEAPAK